MIDRVGGVVGLVACAWILSFSAGCDEAGAPARARAGGSAALETFDVDALDLPTVLERSARGDFASVEDVIEALPVETRASLVLMEHSESQQAASVDAPRVVLYGADARIVFAFSTDPNDPAYDKLEMFDLDRETGRFRFAELDFSVDPPAVDQTRCVACHGDSPRPIWGAYPDWPGAFGEHENEPSPAQATAFRGFAEERDPRFTVISEALGGDYWIDARGYGYPNTSFNYELGRRVAEGIVLRARASPEWERWAPALVAARVSSSHEPTDPEVVAGLFALEGSIEAHAPRPEVAFSYERVLEILGLDASADFAIAIPASRASLRDGEMTLWNAGSEYLLDVVTFLVFHELASGDAALRETMAPTWNTTEALYAAGFTATPSERQSAAAHASTDLYFDPTQAVFAAALEGDGATARRDAFFRRLLELHAR